MKGLDDMLLLGDPRLYEVCAPISPEELPLVEGWVKDLHDVMEAIRARYKFGRGIAAPQIGVMKRLFYLNLDKPYIIINPEIVNPSEELFDLWDDCMSFPNLLVKVQRHKHLTLRYYDEHMQLQEWFVEDAISELIQHEYDHLNGVLCTMRAINPYSFKWRPS